MTLSHFFSRRWVVIAMLAAAPLCSAANDPTSDFHEGLWSLTLYGSYTHDMQSTDVRMGGGTVGVGYYFKENLSLSAEFSGAYVGRPQQDTGAGEADLVLRHHLLHGDRWSVFLDVAGGLFEAGRDVPESGTRFDFIFQSGAGVAWRLKDNAYLLGGARYFHLSNAALEGRERNPSINGFRAYVGLMFTF